VSPAPFTPRPFPGGFKKVCIDRPLTRDLARPHGPVGADFAIAPINRQWQNASTLTIGFIGGTEAQRQMVRDIAPQWTQYANLKFKFVDYLPAQVRVSFDPNEGSWSYIGLDANDIPATAPTMNLGWQDEAVILHEFGHAIGLAHEHQNPRGGIQWNKPNVLRDLAGPPNFWDAATVQHNVFDTYAVSSIKGTVFDPFSIMLYAFPASWTLNGFSTAWNQTISLQDAAFVGGPLMYPPSGLVQPVKLPVQKATPGAITLRGEQDDYTFDVTPAMLTNGIGIFTIETAGATDTFLSLYRGTQLIAYDDDSGVGWNARIRAQLSVGTYRVVARHKSKMETGSYRLLVWT
jgi:hypothetical protein